MNSRTAKIVVTLFFAAIILLCFVFTYGISSYLKSESERTAGLIHQSRCVGIIRADTIMVEYEGRTETVRLIGIRAPDTVREDAVDGRRVAAVFAPGFLMDEGAISRNTLAAWIFMRSLRLVFPYGPDTRDEEGRLLAYADLHGIDIATKLLQGGQLFATDDNHPRMEQYKALEDDARLNRRGLWRAASRLDEGLSKPYES